MQQMVWGKCKYTFISFLYFTLSGTIRLGKLQSFKDIYVYIYPFPMQSLKKYKNVTIIKQVEKIKQNAKMFVKPK